MSRSSALNRALGELTTILNTADTLPKAEQGLIIDIANNWQAGENNDNTQQVILSHLAKHTAGLTINELIELTGIDETDLQNALEVLKRHDVVVENQGRWRIIVELFQRWVEKSHP